MSSSAKDWKTYYETDYDMTKLNIQMDKVLALCKFENLEEECNTSLKQNSGLAILVVDSFKEVHLFHQVHILGPNLLFPAERIMALSGQVFPAPCFQLNSDYMFANMEVPVPNWVQLKEVEDVASVRSLVVTHENPPILKCKNVLTVPPLVVSSVMASKTTDPEILLLNLLQDIKTYHKDFGDSSVIKKLRSVLEFL